MHTIERNVTSVQGENAGYPQAMGGNEKGAGVNPGALENA
jgi:hypothetical protein